MNQGENARILAEAAANFTSDQPINIDLLDAVVSIVNSATGDILNQANALLVQLKDDPNAWSKVDVILERSKSTETKYLALQILESTVLTKWKALPVEQREGVKSFVAQHVISLSNSSSPKNAGQQLLLQKLDIVLVQIVKKDWPQNWPTLVPDLIGSADTDIGVCINVMKIFALLSEDVFDFGSQNLTQTAEAHLKKSFCHQFETVFTFCLRVLNQCPSNELVDAILKTIRRFMSWIPITTVFGTDIIPMLTQKFLPMDSYRIAALQCLEEIAAITQIPEEYRQNLKDMYYTSIRALAEYVGQTFNFADAYQKGTEADQTFMKALTDFLVIFLKEHGELVESHDGISFELHDYAIRMLISLTTIDDTEIFKMCLEYWLDLTGDLYHLNPFNNQLSMFPEMSRHTVNITRANLYKSRLSELRAIIIDRMAKPEEVLIVENECGEVVREIVKDTDTINLYKTMRETLVFLTHLDQQDTTLKMTQKMATQTTGGAFSWKSLNTLCWAVGSISGAMPEEEEKQFLVLIIRELLGLCEQKRGKDNKAVIAANIMYVVGQYPRFLRAYWKFLKTVVNKLFEFMHESHEGVQDMACDTFIKIAMKCKRHFTVLQPGECEPFVEDMLVNMRRNTCDLSYSQSYVFFEAMGYIISSKGGAEDQAALISRLMNEANSVWDQIIAQLSQDIAALGDISVVKTTIHVLRMNTAVAKAVGGNFFSQLARNLSDMLSLYQLVSQQMSNAVLQSGPEILKTPVVKQIRALKKEILVLISTWTAKQDMVEELKDTVAPPLFDTILFDYKSNVPEARDPKVLSLLAIVATQLSSHMHPHVERVLDSVFMCTLEMINKDFSDFPEHRTNFFQLIVSLVASSFPVIIRLSTEQMRLILEAVYWAFQHSMRNVAELGLDIVKTIVHNVNMMTIIAQENEIAQAFYANHLMSILEHLLAVVTDSSQVHVTGLTYYAETLCVIFRTVIEFAKVPLNQANPSQSNQEYVTEYISNILKQHYSQNLNENQISVFVLGFFSLYDCVKSMKNHLRDFLVALKECASADTADLFLEEREAEIRSIMDRKRQVPGLLNPDFMDDDDEEATMAATGL